MTKENSVKNLAAGSKDHHLWDPTRPVPFLKVFAVTSPCASRF
jgi:hypothetical protein